MARITFDEYDAARLYEWHLAVLQAMPEDKNCYCSELGKRLAKFIGEKEARRLQKLVKKNPSFTK